MANTSDESWNKFPDAKIRMRENGLKTILEGLGTNGFCYGAIPRILRDDDGIYIELLLNVGEHGSVIALPLEILIPIPAKLLVKKSTKEKKVNATIATSIAPVDELCVKPEAAPAGPATKQS
jgi:hypothetical protein